MHLSFPVMHFAICLYRSKIFCFPPCDSFLLQHPEIGLILPLPPRGKAERIYIHDTAGIQLAGPGKVKLGSPASLAVAAPSLLCQKADGKPKFK